MKEIQEEKYTQADWYEGAKLRDEGIITATNNANKEIQKWSDRAYKFLLEYIKVHNVFMAEDVRKLSQGIVPDPPSNRAWGSTFVRAAKKNIIKRIGYGQVKNPKAHRTPAAIWERV